MRLSDLVREQTPDLPGGQTSGRRVEPNQAVPLQGSPDKAVSLPAQASAGSDWYASAQHDMAKVGALVRANGAVPFDRCASLAADVVTRLRTSDGLPRLLRTPLSLFRYGFKCLRPDTAEMAVSTGAIIEHFDVIVDLGSGTIPSLVDSLLDPFLLQAATERFGHCVISAVSTPAHTELKMMRMAEAPPGIAATL